MVIKWIKSSNAFFSSWSGQLEVGRLNNGSKLIPLWLTKVINREIQLPKTQE